MNIIITGGSGFIGTNLMEYYINKNHNLINIDIKPPRNSNHKDFWRKVDILNKEKLLEIFKDFNPEKVIHLAAKTDLEGSNINDYLSNTQGTQNIIDAANLCTTIKRIVFTSSMLVCKAGHQPLSNNDYCPTTPYGESKVEMEKIIRNSTINSEWCIIRPTSIWGPWFAEPYRNFFDIILKNIFIHPGDNACTKTYGFVGNSIHQIDKLLNAEVNLISEKVFYIGDNPPIQISEWADEISNIHKNKKNLKLPFIVFILLAKTGDLLKLFGIKFPMTSFRLKNMTTNNIINLDHLINITGNNVYSRKQGVELTLKWLKNN